MLSSMICMSHAMLMLGMLGMFRPQYRLRTVGESIVAGRDAQIIYFCTRVKIGDFFSWICAWPSGDPGMVLDRFCDQHTTSKQVDGARRGGGGG